MFTLPRESKPEQPYNRIFAHKGRTSSWFVFSHFIYGRITDMKDGIASHTGIFSISIRDVQGAALSPQGFVLPPQWKQCWKWRKISLWLTRQSQAKCRTLKKDRPYNKDRPEMWLCFWWRKLKLSINSLILQMNQQRHLESQSLKDINSFIWTQTSRYMKNAIMPN